MADQVVLMLASRNHKYLACALNFRGSKALFGRNWGALEDIPFLHFELCYYQAIDMLLPPPPGASGGWRPGLSQSGSRLSAPPDLQPAWIADPGFVACSTRYCSRSERKLPGNANSWRKSTLPIASLAHEKTRHRRSRLHRLPHMQTSGRPRARGHRARQPGPRPPPGRSLGQPGGSGSARSGGRPGVDLRRHQPDAVLHFAAYALVSESVRLPEVYYRNNFVGSLNLLEAMHKKPAWDTWFSVRPAQSMAFPKANSTKITRKPPSICTG